MIFKERIYLLLLSNFIIFALNGQAYVADFDIPTSACLGENLLPINQSDNVNNYEWDFCEGDLLVTPSNSDVTPINQLSSTSRLPLGLDIVEEGGVLYAFVTSRQDNKLLRLDFVNGLDNPATVNDLGNPLLSPALTTGAFNGAEPIRLVNEGGNWYAFVHNGGSSELLLLTFGNSILNTPTASVVLSSIGGLNSGMDYIFTPEGHIVVITNFSGNTISIVRIGSSVTNIPTIPGDLLVSSVLNGSNGALDISLFERGNRWFGLLSSFSNSRIVSLDFGNSMFSDPLSDDVTGSHLYGETPYRVSLEQDGDQYVAFVSSLAGDIIRLNFGSDFFDGIDSSENLDNFGQLSNTWTFHLKKTNSRWFGLTINNTSRQVYKIDFPNDCNVNIDTSTEENPPIIAYSSSGTKTIGLIVSDLNGRSNKRAKSLDVLNSEAPDPLYQFNSVCISEPTIFTPIDQSLSTYSWDFNGDDIVDVVDMTGASQSFDYSALGTGSYTVRLDVSDGTCNNFFEQEITIYDPPPAPSYTFTSPATCKNTEFTFTNTTVDGGYMGPLEYLWEFIDEPSGTVVATANTRDTAYAFSTEGQKTVRLTSSIPGCTEVTEQTLMITPGPTADFMESFACQNEAMQFTNTSTEAVSYSWDFGDGFMSTAPNPSHIFNGVGNFTVTLTATDAEGCIDTEVRPVLVSDRPQISFDFDIPCTSASGIQFFDFTTVDNADLVSWTWFVDDVQVSTDQSPQIVFESSGVKNIRLDVQSSNGCESSYSEDIEVLSSPTPNFAINIGCQGELSRFTDNTVSTGNPIVSWLWTVDGVTYGTQDIEHTFTQPGNYDVTLEVTGQNFCSESITQSIEIMELPSVSFSVEGECNNQLIRASDLSTESSDPVIARRWTLDGQNVGNGGQLVLSDLEDRTYQLSLELETQAGCVISSSQQLVINEAPLSSFTSSGTYGVPNTRLTFTNTSVGGISFQWLLNGEVRSTDAQSEDIVFPAGTHTVSLVAQNSLGCNDTTNQEILIAEPIVDLAIGSFELVSENNIGKIFLEVQNLSNLPVEFIEAQITLENTFSITEQIVEFVDVGQTSLVSLDVGIPLTVTQPSYFCVKLFSQYEGSLDQNPVNDEKCITLDPIIRVEDPFPNPVVDQFRLKLVSNEAGTASISLFNSSGKVEINSIRNVSQGLNNFFLDMDKLNPGIYYVVVDVLGTTHKRKVIKL